MNGQQEVFLTNVRKIQDEVVNVMLTNRNRYDDLDELISDATYEMTCRIMELFDGYYNEELKYRITEMNSNETVNEFSNLHDLCEGYLKCSNK